MRKRTIALAAAALAAAAPAPARAEATVQRVDVPSFDGTRLGGWVIKPAGARGKLPAILISTPYFGQCVKVSSLGRGPCWPTPETPADWAEHPEPVEFLVESGYAVGWFSVRGTGVSGGCWDDMGRREQRDQRVLVEWLASRPWSSGRVGAMGLSAMSATALGAAVERPRALKTIVVSGVNADLYTFNFSPQGLAAGWTLLGSEATYGTDISHVPPGLLRPDPALTVAQAPHQHERACPEVARTMTAPLGGAVTGHRDAGFYEERDMTRRYGRIRASVLIAQGLQDLWQSGHMMQEDAMWSLLRAPKAMYVGQWAHTYPWQSGHSWSPSREDLKAEWLELLRSWLDHHLRKGPKPSILGRARFEDDSRRWHESRAWPPHEARDEALYLAPSGGLTPEPPAAPSAQTFRAYPQAERVTLPRAFLCPAWLDPVEGPGSLVYMTRPVTKRTVIAGNPMAYLDLTADQAGGGLQVTLHDVAPDFTCGNDPARRSPAGARKLTVGGADLRFHHGGYDARPFGGGHVRVDIANLATVLEPGDRLAITVSYGDPIEFAEVGHAPRITVHSGPRADSSQLVVPVLEGGFGGREPKTRFPPRP